VCFQARKVNLSDCDIADALFEELAFSAPPFLEEPLTIQPETDFADLLDLLLISLLIAFDTIGFYLNFDYITSCLVMYEFSPND
jgi:hypothetical protein